MYKNIEETYKKKSPYNIIKKRTFWIYVVFIILSLIFNFLNKVVPMILVFIAMIGTLKFVSEKVLNKKLYFKIGKKNDDEIPLASIINDEERRIFKNFSIENNLYSEKTLLCIVEHYRSLIKTKTVGGNLLAILSITIPVVLSFYTKDGFDFNGLAKAIPYLISFSFMIIMIYFSYREFIEIKKFLKGEDGMVERLEEIFSELYIDCVNSSKLEKKIEISKQQKRKNATNKKTTKKKVIEKNKK